MAYAPGGHGDQPDQPGAALDDDHLRQLSGIGLPSGIEGAQTCGEEVRIPSPVRVMRPDELPAAAPDFAGLGFVHPQAGGRLCPPAESASSSGIRFRLATRTSVGKASAEAGRRSRVRPLIQKSLEARRVSGPGVQEARAREPATVVTVVHSNPRSANSSRAAVLQLTSCSAHTSMPAQVTAIITALAEPNYAEPGIWRQSQPVGRRSVPSPNGYSVVPSGQGAHPQGPGLGFGVCAPDRAGQSWFSAVRIPVCACWPSRSKAGLSSGARRRDGPLKVNSAV